MEVDICVNEHKPERVREMALLSAKNAEREVAEKRYTAQDAKEEVQRLRVLAREKLHEEQELRGDVPEYAAPMSFFALAG